MKKLYELGARTGLTRNEVNRVARFGVLGLLAVGLAALTACFKAEKKEASVQSSSPGSLQDIANSVNQSTAPAKQDCGPWPGYPCGTRYYTVSRSDFRRAA